MINGKLNYPVLLFRIVKEYLCEKVYLYNKIAKI